MNLKMILAVTLFGLVIVGLITFGYVIYAIKSDSTSGSGKAHLEKHCGLLYIQLTLELLQLAAAGGLMYLVKSPY